MNNAKSMGTYEENLPLLLYIDYKAFDYVDNAKMFIKNNRYAIFGYYLSKIIFVMKQVL